MSDIITLNEGSEEFKAIKKGWGEKASAATIETLPGFLKELTEEYRHDYGTICHAVAMAAIAAAWAMNKSKQGGITGFQSGAVMWEFVRAWSHSGNKTGLKLIDYDNFLYPQYESEFDKKLSTDIWMGIQKEARKNIEEADKKAVKYLEDLEQYKKEIAVFVEKYPDYYQRKEHYDPLGMGTGDEWVTENKKKESGFEFAPQKPYSPINSNSRVYKHWKSIARGLMPFGYTLKQQDD